jgi:hypothetical protein
MALARPAPGSTNSRFHERPHRGARRRAEREERSHAEPEREQRVQRSVGGGARPPAGAHAGDRGEPSCCGAPCRRGSRRRWP